MAESESPHCVSASPARSLNACAADFKPRPSQPSGSPSIHRTKSLYFEPDRHIWPNPLARDLGFKRRFSSDCFFGANSTFQTSLQGSGNGTLATTGAFDPFVTATAPLSAAAAAVSAVQANPYAPETTAALGGAAFFAGQTGFQQPVSHLICRQSGSDYFRFNIIYTPRLALIARTLWVTNGTCTISSFPTTSAKNYKRKPRLCFRHYRVCDMRA